MKSLIITALLAISSATFANNKCIDLRAADFGPCEDHEQRFFVQGTCPQSYQAESNYCAPSEGPDCLDLRATLFAPCDGGKTRIHVQGRCSKSYQIEHTYCAAR